jgi:hypothetical protein
MPIPQSGVTEMPNDDSYGKHSLLVWFYLSLENRLFKHIIVKRNQIQSLFNPIKWINFVDGSMGNNPCIYLTIS